MSAVSNMVSEECSVVAYYGIDPGAKAAESFYRMVVQWFTELGHPPDKLSIHSAGQRGKLGAFSRGDAKLRKAGFDGIRGFSLVSTTPEPTTWGGDYYLTASYDGKSDSLFAFVVARSSLATLSPASMLPVARSVAQLLKPVYGIGYRMEHRRGPELYAIGVNHSGGVVLTGDAYEEACNVSRWCDTGMVKQVYRDGMLRDVYPWNFLTQPQLVKPVGGVSLEQWIRQNARRGTVGPLCDGVSYSGPRKLDHRLS
jgi:hypothetical protein